MPVQLIELYRFFYAVCMNLHFAAFEGLDRDDVWQVKFIPAGAHVMEIRQIAEHIGGLAPIIMGGRSINVDSVEKNLEMLEGVLCQLLVAYPHITYRRGSFRQVNPLYRLSLDGSAPEYHGDRPDLDVWRGILTQEEYDYLLTCIYKNGDWRRQLKPLIGMFRIARMKLPEHL